MLHALKVYILNKLSYDALDFELINIKFWINPKANFYVLSCQIVYLSESVDLKVCMNHFSLNKASP